MPVTFLEPLEPDEPEGLIAGRLATSPSATGEPNNPFISPQDLVDYLGRGGTADPGMIMAADAACDMVRTEAEQTFNQVIGDIVTLDGTGTDALLLPQGPVAAAGTVVVDTLGAVTDYVLRDDGVLIRKSDPTTVVTPVVWPAGRQNVTVTYDHGYADADLPRDVRMVALAVAARLVVQGPAIQESIGNVSVRYGVNSTDFTNGELRILRKYRMGH